MLFCRTGRSVWASQNTYTGLQRYSYRVQSQAWVSAKDILLRQRAAATQRRDGCQRPQIVWATTLVGPKSRSAAELLSSELLQFLSLWPSRGEKRSARVGSFADRDWLLRQTRQKHWWPLCLGLCPRAGRFRAWQCEKWNLAVLQFPTP